MLRSIYSRDYTRSLNPITSLLFLIWAFYFIYEGELIFVSAASILLAIYIKVTKRVVPLLLWLAAPTMILLSFLFGLYEAAYTTVKIVLIALAAIVAFTAPKPQHIAYIASKLGAPPIIGFSQLFVLRLIQILSEALVEAMNTAKGRGIRGRMRLIMLLPIPLLVHTINLSTYLAEALYIKYPNKMRTWTEKASLSIADVILVFCIVITLILHGITSYSVISF